MYPIGKNEQQLSKKMQESFEGRESNLEEVVLGDSELQDLITIGRRGPQGGGWRSWRVFSCLPIFRRPVDANREYVGPGDGFEALRASASV